MFDTFLYILIIVGGVLFGISISIMYVVTTSINKIKDNSVSNKVFDTDYDENIKEIINKAKHFQYIYQYESKLNSKIKNQNKIRKFFKKEEKPLVKLTYSFKDILMYLVFEEYLLFHNTNDQNYLFFSEKDLYSYAKTVINKVDGLLNSIDSMIIKNIKLSTILTIIDLYGSYNKFTDKVGIIILIKVFNFFMTLYRFISPISIIKLLIKRSDQSDLIEVLNDNLLNLIGFELANILYKESFEKDENLHN